MHCKSLIFLSGLVPALAAVTTVWVESTVFYCPCTSSTLTSDSPSISAPGTSSVSGLKSSALGSSPFASLSSSGIGGSSGASLASSGISTSTPSSQVSVTPTTVVSSPATTISTSTPTSTGPGTCIALNGDCSNETQTFFCCSGLTCDVTLGSCVPDDSGSTIALLPPTVVLIATSTTPSSPTSTAPGSCIPLNGDCSNETMTFFCYPGFTCDVAINTCVVDN